MPARCVSVAPSYQESSPPSGPAGRRRRWPAASRRRSARPSEISSGITPFGHHRTPAGARRASRPARVSRGIHSSTSRRTRAPQPASSACTGQVHDGDRQLARRRIGDRPLAGRDHRRQRATAARAADGRARPAAPLLAQRPDRVDHDGRLLDRVDRAAVVPARLRAPRRGRAGRGRVITPYSEPRHATQVSKPVASVTMPASARSPSLDDRRPAGARRLLVGVRRDEQVAGERDRRARRAPRPRGPSQRSRPSCRRRRGRRACRRAPRRGTVARPLLPRLGGDDVDVAVEEQRPAAARAAQARDSCGRPAKSSPGGTSGLPRSSPASGSQRSISAPAARRRAARYSCSAASSRGGSPTLRRGRVEGDQRRTRAPRARRGARRSVADELLGVAQNISARGQLALSVSGLSEAAVERTSLLDEARSLIDLATERGVVLRLVGGLAVRVLCPDLPPRSRTGQDLDFCSRRLVAPAGCSSCSPSAATRRQDVQRALRQQAAVFHPDRDGRALDVRRQAGDVPHPRLRVESCQYPYTLESLDVLLSKLQIVELNAKDADDCLRLLVTYPLADGPSRSMNLGSSATGRRRLGLVADGHTEPREDSRLLDTRNGASLSRRRAA